MITAKEARAMVTRLYNEQFNQRLAYLLNKVDQQIRAAVRDSLLSVKVWDSLFVHEDLRNKVIENLKLNGYKAYKEWGTLERALTIKW